MEDAVSNIGIILVIGLVALAFVGVIVFIARNYIKVPPNTALVLFGGGKTRYVASGAVFRIPLLHSVRSISLETFQIEVRITDTPNVEGVPVTLDAVANLKIAAQEELLKAAAQRFLGVGQKDIEHICRQSLEGMMRQLAGTLTVEEMVKEREKISQSFLKDSLPELEKLGVRCDNFLITRVDDELGYIDALGKKRTAEVKRDAEIGEAEARRDATIKSSVAKREGEQERLSNEEDIAEAERNLNLKKAQFDREVATERAKAEMAKPLADAELKQDLTRREVAIEVARTEARIEVAKKEATRKQEELVATEIRPAEAGREAAVIRANGQAQAITIQATADKERLTKEGEGLAAAEAVKKQQIGLAEAAANRAKLLAEADGIRAKGEAEGRAVEAKALAEAEGFKQKNQALAQLSDGARLIMTLEMLPPVIDESGNALEQALHAAMEPIGTGLSRIEHLNVWDNSGNSTGTSPLNRVAMVGPNVIFNLVQQIRAIFGENWQEQLPAVLSRILKSGAQAAAATDGAASPSQEQPSGDESAAPEVEVVVPRKPVPTK